MAEFIMKDIVRKHHKENEFEIASSATSREEIGNPVYPPAQRVLEKHGIFCREREARQLTAGDYDYYDLLVVMDHNNLKNTKRIIGNDYDNKLRLLMDYTGQGGTVSDPWYTRDFERAFQDIRLGCEALWSSVCNL